MFYFYYINKKKWGWQIPQLPRAEKSPNQNHEKRVNYSYIKTRELCEVRQNIVDLLDKLIELLC